jgi:hypothetical protein
VSFLAAAELANFVVPSFGYGPRPGDLPLNGGRWAAASAAQLSPRPQYEQTRRFALVALGACFRQPRGILTLCSATGIIARTFLTLAGSIRAETMPTPSEALAITWPHGSATSEWP